MCEYKERERERQRQALTTQRSFCSLISKCSHSDALFCSQRSPRVMYFSSDQGDTFSRALLPSASTEQVRKRFKCSSRPLRVFLLHFESVLGKYLSYTDAHMLLVVGCYVGWLASSININGNISFFNTN